MTCFVIGQQRKFVGFMVTSLRFTKKNRGYHLSLETVNDIILPMLKPYQTISLSIDSMGSAGEGIGLYHGMRIFVDGALPGECVEAQLTVVKKTYAKGIARQILTPSPDRVRPPCPYFDRCGGCQVMHLNYEAQLKIKQKRVQDALERIGGFKGVSVNPCVPSPEIYGYRNKIQLPVQGSPLKIGLYERRSHNLIDIEACLIHCDLGEALFRDIRRLLSVSDIKPYCTRTGKGELRHVLIKSAINRGEALVVFVANGDASSSLKYLAKTLFEKHEALKGIVLNRNRGRTNAILGKHYQTLEGQGTIEEVICGLRFKVSPASFFQVNVHQAEALYQYVVDAARSAGSVIDAYCGVGTLSLLLASRNKHVVGIESVPQAIEDARQNAAANQLSNVHFLCQPVEQALDHLIRGDLLILNPPRKGCAPEVIDAVSQKRLIYVSCDPATCARDLSRLNGYDIVKVQPFDMFPQTSHVETVVVLEKSAEA